jgi:hypothetical protein
MPALKFQTVRHAVLISALENIRLGEDRAVSSCRVVIIIIIIIIIIILLMILLNGSLQFQRHDKNTCTEHC